MEFGKFSGDFFRTTAAADSQIAAAEQALGLRLPQDYRQFLQGTNGGHGWIGENYVMLWGADQLAEYNMSYQVEEYAPGLVLFGSDGGGEGFAFDSRTDPATVVMVPFVGMSLADTIAVAPGFAAFLERLQAGALF